jgi:hypothetical protein
MKTPAFIKTIAATVSSAAAAVKATIGRQADRFEAFKDEHPRFKRVWNVLTHPTTTRILGIAVSLAIAPLTGGFTLPLTVSLALSGAVIFSTTIYMGIQRYRLEKAKARLKVVKEIGAKRSDILDLAQKPGLDKKVEALKKERPDLDALLAPKPTELPEKQRRRVGLTVAQSLYYEGVACLSVMIACFGVGGAFGFASAVGTGVSGFIGQTRRRLQATQVLHDTQDARQDASAEEGLGHLKPAEETEMLMKGRALTAALKAVEKDSELSLTDAYAAQLAAQRLRSDSPSPPGIAECVFDEFNPFRAEPPKQEPEPASDAATEKQRSTSDGRHLTPPHTPLGAEGPQHAKTRHE